MPLKIYIAASSADMDRVHTAITKCKENGFEIVCAWPTVVANTAGGANPADATKEERVGWAKQDLAEVASSDVLWFLVPHSPKVTRGAWWEAGAAYTLGKYVVSSGPSTHQSVFCALGQEFATDDEALLDLKLLSNELHNLRGW